VKIFLPVRFVLCVGLLGDGRRWLRPGHPSEFDAKIVSGDAVEVDWAVSRGRALAVTGREGAAGGFLFWRGGWSVWRSNEAGRLGNRYLIRKRSRRSERSRWAFDPQIIYVGTGRRTCARHFLREWDVQVCGRRENLGAHRAGGFAADCADSDRSERPGKTFVAALGHAYGPNAERGVFYSKDGGRSGSTFCFMTRIQARSI